MANGQKRGKQIIGALGIFCLSYVIFSIVSQAPQERSFFIIISLIVIFISLAVIGYTMITGRRNKKPD